MPVQVEPEMGAPSSNTGKLFSLTDVYRIYGEEPVAVHALDGVSVEVNAGDFMAIIGPSGSGKSTLLGLLGCLDLPTRGSIKVSGTEVTELDDAERSKLRGDSIGFVFQQFHLIPHLTALGNVSTALLYRNMTKNERKDRDGGSNKGRAWRTPRPSAGTDVGRRTTKGCIGASYRHRAFNGPR